MPKKREFRALWTVLPLGPFLQASLGTAVSATASPPFATNPAAARRSPPPPPPPCATITPPPGAATKRIRRHSTPHCRRQAVLEEHIVAHPVSVEKKGRK
uniref:Secreted protein n=1 Tax=Oryza glumipatula TaxID=40148 RepID=A0A0D9Y8E9_9ORYZ